MHDLVYTGTREVTDKFKKLVRIQMKASSDDIEETYDEIHEYRVSVELPDDKRRNYYEFMIRNGFAFLSLTLQLALMGNPDASETRAMLREIVVKLEGELGIIN